MSGHSKWSKVKHQKATTDAVKSAAFTKASRAVTIAVREGGGISDPEKNFRLRLAIELAKAVNMPKDNIERAIAKGAGDSGTVIETVHYEGYGPGGVAFVVEAATDNRQRTGAAMKHQFDRAGGALGGPGSVSFLFSRTGIVLIEKSPSVSYDAVFEIAVSNNADDVVEKDDVYEVYVDIPQFAQLKDALGKSFTVTHADMIMRPLQLSHPEPDVVSKNEALISVLEESDDVQNVYTNLD